MSEVATTAKFDAAPPVSIATRLFLALLIFLLVGGLVLGVFLVRTLIPNVTSDPVAAQTRLDEFLTIDLPDDFAPIATLDWKLLYLIPMSGVWAEADGGDSVISVVRLEGSMRDDPKVRKRAIEALRDQSIGSGTVEKTEPMTAVVNGREREVNVLLVREPSGSRSRVVGVDIELRGHPFLIEIKRPASDFDSDETKVILKSIR